MKKINVVLHLVSAVLLVLFSFMFYVMFDESEKIHDSSISVFNSRSPEKIPAALVQKVIAHENHVARLYVISSDMFNVVILTTIIFSITLIVVMIKAAVVSHKTNGRLKSK